MQQLQDYHHDRASNTWLHDCEQKFLVTVTNPEDISVFLKASSPITRASIQSSRTHTKPIADHQQLRQCAASLGDEFFIAADFTRIWGATKSAI